MNAAYLLVTSAMLVGQGGDKKVEPVAPPKSVIVTPAPVPNGSCGTTECCESFGHKLRCRLRGLFQRDNCDCQPASCDRGHHHQRNDCNDGCRQKIWNGFNRGHHNNCAPQTCNDSCNNGGHGFFEKLRGGFHRRDNCCDGGCGTNVGPVGPVGPPIKGEKIDAPKKMPEPPKKTSIPQEVRIYNQPTPIAPNAIPVVPNPTVEVTPLPTPVVPVTPVPAPRVEGDRRDPF